jgi:hypothetical protein
MGSFRENSHENCTNCAAGILGFIFRRRMQTKRRCDSWLTMMLQPELRNVFASDEKTNL